MGFIDQMRAGGHAAWSIIRVLREQDVKVAARTYRAWRQGRVSTRTLTDAMVVDAVRDAAWRVDELPDGTTRRRMTPESLYGRKKMTALIRRTAFGDATRGAVNRAMRALGQGVSQLIVAWHAQTTKHTDLVMIPLRIALWERDRQGHPFDWDGRRRVRQRPHGNHQRALQG